MQNPFAAIDTARLASHGESSTTARSRDSRAPSHSRWIAPARGAAALVRAVPDDASGRADGLVHGDEAGRARSEVAVSPCSGQSRTGRAAAEPHHAPRPAASAAPSTTTAASPLRHAGLQHQGAAPTHGTRTDATRPSVNRRNAGSVRQPQTAGVIAGTVACRTRRHHRAEGGPAPSGRPGRAAKAGTMLSAPTAAASPAANSQYQSVKGAL